MIRFADRLNFLQNNVFADMDRGKAKARGAGLEVIDLSLGSSDRPTAPHVLDAIARSLPDTSTHGYQLFNSTRPFREACAQWYTDKYGIPVDPETEVLALIGSQEGTAHLPLAILNPGDIAIVLDPGYPSHYAGICFAGGEMYPLSLREDNGFLPDFSDIPASVWERSRMMVLNYPHNPTAATAPLSFFKDAVELCLRHNVILVHDAPYAEFVYDGKPASPSVFQADGEKAISIELFSLSKTYSMGGFRVGYAIGNAEIIRGLRQVKSAIDFNQYQGIFNGAIAALQGSQTHIQETIGQFQQRRDAFIAAMNDIGWAIAPSAATMFVWAKLPKSWEKHSIEFCTQLVETTGVAASPGAGFGSCGEGYVRFALVRDPAILQQAAARIGQFLQR
nr:LL-diaminopimelate aminotransferase [Roseofilum casamattae]